MNDMALATSKSDDEQIPRRHEHPSETGWPNPFRLGGSLIAGAAAGVALGTAIAGPIGGLVGALAVAAINGYVSAETDTPSEQKRK